MHLVTIGILSSPLLRLTSRKPLWLDLQPVDIKSRWRHNWKSAQVVNSHLMCDPTIRQLGFDLPRQQWSLLNRFRTEQGHCGACRRKCDLLNGEFESVSLWRDPNDFPHCPKKLLPVRTGLVAKSITSPEMFRYSTAASCTCALLAVHAHC